MMHVLIIEPDRLLGRTYTDALKAAGYSVAYAPTAQAAIVAADEKMPDIVVLEMLLPTHNGIAFLQEFRSYQDWQQVPVSLHTFVAPHTYQDIQPILQEQYGVVSWLYKPQAQLRHLLAAVKQQLVEA